MNENLNWLYRLWTWSSKKNGKKQKNLKYRENNNWDRRLEDRNVGSEIENSK